MSEQNDRAPRPSRMFGRFQKVVGIALILLALFAFNEARQGRVEGVFAAIVVAILAVVAGFVGSRVFVSGKQRTALTADEKMAKDPRPPVLYLRAFNDDEVASTRWAGSSYPFPIALNTEEEQLARVFDPVGPMIGLGRPGSPLPGLGAAREWVSDEEWQAKVLDMMDRASLVVLRLAETEGVWWEIAKSRERLRPERLVLVVPFGQSEYDRLRPRVEELMGVTLPHFVEGKHTATIQGLVMFDRDGRSRFLPIERSWMRTSALNPVASELQSSVEPLFDQLGVRYSRPGPAPLRVWVTILVIATIVGIIITLVALAMGIPL